MLASFLFHAALFASTYHVSPSGNDAFEGTASAPWRTLQYAIQHAYPGDTILIARGTYAEAIQSVRHGEQAAPIVLTGSEGESVVLDGTQVDWSTGVLLTHDFIHLEGIIVQNWSGTGIWLDGAGYTSLRDCLIRSCPFGVGAGNGAHDFLLHRVEIRDFDFYGFDASSSGGADCFRGTLIECSAHSARDLEQNVDGFALGHGNQWGFRFNQCEAYGVFDGFDISAQGTSLEACSSHDNENAGFKIWADRVSLTNCLAFANGICHVELDWDGEPGTTTLRNCTFFNANVYSIWVENANDRLDMANCIVAGGKNIGLAFEQPSFPNYVGDYNLFHNGNVNRALSVGYAEEFSLTSAGFEAWKRTSGQDVHSLIVGDISTVFLDVGAHDFRLSPISPAIDQGSNLLAPPVDIEDTPRPCGRGSDIGAWEYNAAAQHAP